MRKSNSYIFIILITLFFHNSSFSQDLSNFNYNAINSGIPWLDNNENVVNAQGEYIIKEKDTFYLFGESHTVTIFIDKNSDELIKWAVTDFSKDLETISGKKVSINYTDTFHQNKKGIYIGKFDDKLIKNLPKNDSNKLQNQWEHFSIKKNKNNLFIFGSDVRGTVYGVFDLAERIGISPWKWWADVTPLKKENIVLKLPETGINESPSVQYRGIFLNDEDWGLQPWAAHTFEPETNDIGPKTYEKIFQLLLRLKANTIWPAMHPSTKAFFKVPGNKEMAEKYHISIGTSHAEPMLRNNVDEWNKKEFGEYNYFNNRDNVKEYWQERISELKTSNNIITMGMRGIHDSGMEGNVSKNKKVEILQTIIRDQREILSNTLKQPIQDIPQVLIPYKEVLDIYNDSLQVPDDITLMWTDDNYGYIRRLSDDVEQQRKGGSGVYYHLSYWGRPHDYLWLSTTQPGLIWYEMSRAYQNGAKKIWIANVGDIKPSEYAMEFFLDLAWDIHSINETTINKHLKDWTSREFGNDKAQEIANLLQEYYRLAFLRKPEFMGWSKTEPQTDTQITAFTTNNNNELQRRIDAYTTLFNKAERIKSFIVKERLDAYFQLVEYPIKSAALMNHKFLYTQQAFISNDSLKKEKLNTKSQVAYDSIVLLTKKYNNDISDGKWSNMMSMSPRNLSVYKMPTYHLSKPDSTNNKKHIQNSTLDPIFLQASNYSKKGAVKNFYWKSIKGLGYSDSSVTLFPFSNHLFENEKPYLEYHFNIEKTGEYNIEIRCLPNHSNNFDHKIWIKINEGDDTEYAINTKGRSDTWKENVLQNFTSVKQTVMFNKTGKQNLKIAVNQTGIVIDQIAINPKGYGAYYEIKK
ncbi:Glycosyl hydrolase family 115 [Flaviramulus basaltis]|uniref:Glycosyl hydrolase family 115 n=1 Tax=Flaviramulus basaltis TaxID=369401 RepID=A0A1K2IQT4_9FLAO|nr:glycosyl hydrolase 115 family protein [Flaviramulus basaltis]SFZ94075.1 Glycosyl hydrolase family 115 [Flaviramulus basaltis]